MMADEQCDSHHGSRNEEGRCNLLDLGKESVIEQFLDVMSIYVECYQGIDQSANTYSDNTKEERNKNDSKGYGFLYHFQL